MPTTSRGAQAERGRRASQRPAAGVAAAGAGPRRGAGRISILCGNGGQFPPEEMERGADGAMTGFAFPEMMAGVVRLFHAGGRERMHGVLAARLPLVRYESRASGRRSASTSSPAAAPSPIRRSAAPGPA